VASHVWDFVESLHQAQLYAGVLFGFTERAAPAGSPGIQRLGTQEDADGKGCFAVGGHIEDEFCGGCFRITVERRPLTDKIVLVNVSRLAGVGFDSANSHAAYRSVGLSRSMAAAVSELTGE
jgi:hypothetical protein